jgi:hypothetical protein
MLSSRRLFATSKHPLVVLVAATLLGSVLIPAVNGQVDRQRRLRELKAERGNAALRSAWDVERKLNLLHTAFVAFYKDEVVSGQATRASRQALRERVYALHQDFDRDAWWWHWQMLEEVKVLGLLDAGALRQLEQAVNHYQDALLATSDPIDRYWARLIRDREPVPGAGGVSLIDEVAARMKELGDRRRQAIRDMVRAIIS